MLIAPVVARRASWARGTPNPRRESRGAYGARADFQRAVGGGVGYDASVDEAHSVLADDVGPAAQRVDDAGPAAVGCGGSFVRQGGEHDSDSASDRQRCVQPQELQLRGVCRWPPDHGRGAAGGPAPVRVGREVLDEVDRHRDAAGLQVRGVAGVGDDAVDGVGELGSGAPSLLDRRVGIEVARLHEDGNVRNRVSLKRRAGGRIGWPVEALRSGIDVDAQPRASRERPEWPVPERRQSAVILGSAGRREEPPGHTGADSRDTRSRRTRRHCRGQDRPRSRSPR